MSTVLTSAARTAASLMTAVLFGCLLGLLRTFVTGLAPSLGSKSRTIFIKAMLACVHVLCIVA